MNSWIVCSVLAGLALASLVQPARAETPEVSASGD